MTASYEAKALYSAEREKIAQEIFQLCRQADQDRGIITEQVLLRKIGLPAVVANAIQEKLRREQEAEQMKFVLQKEQQEAERKRIEAQGIADFQRIVAQGISAQLLEWKGIEATEKLAASPNTKIVVIGNPKTACRSSWAARVSNREPGPPGRGGSGFTTDSFDFRFQSGYTFGLWLDFRHQVPSGWAACQTCRSSRFRITCSSTATS